MSVSTIILYRGDLLPKLEIEVRDQSGNPINLAQVVSVRFYMGILGEVPMINGVDCVVTNAAKGLCEYQWVADDTQTVGEFTGEIVITFAGGRPETAGQFEIKIVDSLHGAG